MIKYRRELKNIIDLSLPVVELGVAEGNFSEEILSWGVKLYSVDNWGHLPQTGDGGFEQEWHDKNYNKALQRLSKYGRNSFILKGKTVDMAKHVEDNSIGLLYIDADHSYMGVLNDLNAWFPKVVKGGIIAFHDYENEAYGVKQAVKDFTKGKYEIIPIPEDKKDDAGAYFVK